MVLKVFVVGKPQGDSDNVGLCYLHREILLRCKLHLVPGHTEFLCLEASEQEVSPSW